MADDWKSYVDLDGTHVHVAANAPTNAAELLKQRALHPQQLVHAPGGDAESYALGELVDHAWGSGEFAQRYELVPRIRFAVDVLDEIANVLDSTTPLRAWALRQVSRVLLGVEEVPRG